MRPGGSISPRMESPVTLLPEPDSPTSPTTSPAADIERHAVDRLHDARAGEEMRLQVADLEQAHRLSLGLS